MFSSSTDITSALSLCLLQCA